MKRALKGAVDAAGWLSFVVGTLRSFEEKHFRPHALLKKRSKQRTVREMTATMPSSSFALVGRLTTMSPNQRSSLQPCWSSQQVDTNNWAIEKMATWPNLGPIWAMFFC
jgi:hypothetical protein